MISVLKLLAAVVLGSGFGALVGSLRSCPDGGCPLTSTPFRGAFWGGFIGLMAVLSLSGCPRSETTQKETSANPQAGVLEITKQADFDREVVKYQGKVLVDFGAPWCGACQSYKPIFHKAAEQFADSAKFVSVNTDNAADLAKKYNIEYLPTTILFENGAVKKKVVGLVEEDKLSELLQGGS